MDKEEIVLYESPEAAQHKTVILTGWWSRNGRFWKDDERAARYDGCTHRTCECGNTMTRDYIRCDDCRHKTTVENYKKLPIGEWDGKAPICTYDGDKYFFHEEDLIDYLEEQEITCDDIMLVLCKPNKFHNVQEDYWADELPTEDEYDFPKDFLDALAQLNDVIDKMEPCSYSPGKIRISYKYQPE